MKRSIAFLLSLLAISAVSSVSVCAADSAQVTVTIADAQGKLAVAAEPVTVTDVDKDGSLTIYDALYQAHEVFYTGGAASGFAAVTSEYGLSLDMLWGSQNGGSYGYYVNNASAMSLADPVKDGDYLNAFVYTDLEKWTDMYCYFDTNTVSVQEGNAAELTLYAASLDENWQPVTLPVADAYITVDGSKSEWKTDAQGKVTVTLDDPGSHVLSAVSDSHILVPPVCKAEVTAAPVQTQAPVQTPTQAPAQTPTQAPTQAAASSAVTSTVPPTGDNIHTAVWIAAASALICAAAARKANKKK